MKEFMDKDFLLETETAKHLFHDYAEHLPLVAPRKMFTRMSALITSRRSGLEGKTRTAPISVTTISGA